MRGRATRRRCFLTDESRCIMPAFGAYAGGLNACDPAFRPLFPNGFTAHLIGARADLRDRPRHALPGLSRHGLNPAGR